GAPCQVGFLVRVVPIPRAAKCSAIPREQSNAGVMAHVTGVETARGDATAENKGGGKLVLGLVLLVGLAIGAAAGVFVLAPRVSGLIGSGGADFAAEVTEFDRGGAEGGGRASRSNSPGELYSVENLVINPAGTKGTRFLMT